MNATRQRRGSRGGQDPNCFCAWKLKQFQSYVPCTMNFRLNNYLQIIRDAELKILSKMYKGICIIFWRIQPYHWVNPYHPDY